MEAAAILARFVEAVNQQQIKISLHATEEALAEEITRSDIETVLSSAQVVEDYPEWWLGPSCLVYGKSNSGRDIHIVASYSGLPITVITVYEPRPPKWRTPTLRGGNS